MFNVHLSILIKNSRFIVTVIFLNKFYYYIILHLVEMYIYVFQVIYLFIYLFRFI